ncbi:MAG: flavin reductase family protein [Gemmatimonadaceae bacterium]|nr:flavin reductase family protein [Gemmatimonadaceae bacterium]
MIDRDSFRAALSRFASGVTVVTVRDADGTDHGMTVSAFSSVSLTPPLVLACIDEAASMAMHLHDRIAFGISILAADQAERSQRFADPAADRFAGVAVTRAASGVALLDGAVATLACTATALYPAGDHRILVGQVDDVQLREGAPLVYHRGAYARLSG